MTSHQLAAILLRGPDKPVALEVYRHFYHSELDRCSQGRLKACYVPAPAIRGGDYVYITQGSDTRGEELK